MKKKFLTMLLAVVMAFSLLPVTAFAANASGSCGANVKWSYNNGILTIEGTGPMRDYGLDGAPWYGYRGQIHTVKIGDGVTSVGEWAFYFCEKLTSVTIPNSVTAIGSSAFWQCNSLTAVTIPDSIKSIGDSAFAWCASLTSVTIPSDITAIEPFVFLRCSGMTDVSIPNSVTSIGLCAFSYCESLTSVTIPDSVTTIGEKAFHECASLINVTIPNSVKSFGMSAFQGCSSLTSVVIPDGATSITAGLFSLCSGLTSMTIPASVTAIGSMAFNRCDSLKDVYYGGSESQWGKIVISFMSNNSLTNATVHYNSAMPTTPTEPTTPIFTDVPAGEWYADPVAWAVQNEITNGYGAKDKFAPGVDCTEAQILTFLYRAAGEPSAAKSPVSVAASYQDAINWAYEKGMIDRNFKENTPCTRATAVKYIWQAFDKPKAEKASSFTDVDKGADYAEAVNWAVEKDITNGHGGNDTFAPDKVCDRGTIVTFLYRAYKEN